MPLSLDALPPELISCVVANIASPRALCNLAQCSRRLHLCTIPHLYRHVIILENSQSQTAERRYGRLQKLASLLIRRPDLAGLVRLFTLRITTPPGEYEECFEERGEPFENGSPEFIKIDQAFATAATSSSLSKEEKIHFLGRFSPTHRSYYDSLLALLLPALLQMEKLVLDWDSYYDTYYLEQMMGSVACMEKSFDTPSPFEALRVFFHSHRFHLRSTGFIASLLKLSAIQEISGAFEKSWKDRDYNFGQIIPSGKGLKDLDSSSSPLISLDLTAYRLSAADLEHILRAPKALKTLIYRVCQPACLHFKVLRHALGPQENCLESLDLDCDSDCGYESNVLGSMTSFVSFNALKVFKIAARYLELIDNVRGSEVHSLIDIFPPNLETLHLTRFPAAFTDLLKALEHLLAQKSSQQVPSLKRVILDKTRSYDSLLRKYYGMAPVRLADVTWKGSQETVLGRLRRVAAAKGVSIDVIEFGSNAVIEEATDEESLEGEGETEVETEGETEGETEEETEGETEGETERETEGEISSMPMLIIR